MIEYASLLTGAIVGLATGAMTMGVMCGSTIIRLGEERDDAIAEKNACNQSLDDAAATINWQADKIDALEAERQAAEAA